MPRKRGAPPETLAQLADRNEQRHREALARGSRYALATERRRQQRAATAADAAAAGSPPPLAPPPPPSGDATPPPDAAEPAADPGGRPASLTRTLLDEGITGLIRRRRSG